MIKKELEQIILQGESEKVEFKQSFGKKVLNTNVYLNNRQENMIKDILLNKYINQIDLADKYNVSDKTIKRDLQYLQENSIIKRVGSKKKRLLTNNNKIILYEK